MSKAHAIFLRCNDTGKLVEAILYERVDGVYARKVDESWAEYHQSSESQAKAEGKTLAEMEHSHWNWEAKVADSSRLLSCPTLAIEYEGETQGLMLLKTDGHFARAEDEKGQPLVYVPFLATAPWNLGSGFERPRYSGVGTILMSAAVQMSIEAEFKGRVGLHSLPQAETFYECHGMSDFGSDPDKEHLKYYELSAKAAAKFLSRKTP